VPEPARFDYEVRWQGDVLDRATSEQVGERALRSVGVGEHAQHRLELVHVPTGRVIMYRRRGKIESAAG
jgi:hypothetical protein